MTRPPVRVLRDVGVESFGPSTSVDTLSAAPVDLSDVAVWARPRSSAELESVLDAVMRGASVTVVLDGDLEHEAEFLDQLARIADLSESVAPPPLDEVTLALLGRLAAGESTAAAARAVGMSLRSAYRVLAQARELFGVVTTTELLVSVSAEERGDFRIGDH